MFERFTERAIKVVMLAQEEARGLGWNFVGTEMLLLGLMRDGSCLGAIALKKHGLNIDVVRQEVEKIIGRGAQPVKIEVPFTPRAKRCLMHSWNLSQNSTIQVIGTEHVLLGLLLEAAESTAEEKDGVACRVLKNLGIDLEALRQDALALMEARTAPSAAVVEVSSVPKKNVSPEGTIVLASAQQEARRIGHQFVGTEQILLGIVAQRKGIAAQTLLELGVDLERGRLEVEKIIGYGREGMPFDGSLTPRAKRALELSWTEARERGQDFIATEHLLLGLIREGGGVAITVLVNMDIKPELVRKKLLEKMGNAT